MHSVRYDPADRTWQVVNLADPFGAVVIEEFETLLQASELCSVLNGGFNFAAAKPLLRTLSDTILLAIELLLERDPG
jgi:hypothetical protein